jgi:hypothetical protein
MGPSALAPTWSAPHKAISILAAAVAAFAGCAESPDAIERQFVEQRCSGCHGLPSADSFPSAEWPTVVDWMNDVMQRTGEASYEAADLARITDYYTAHSPKQLPALPPDPARVTLGFEARPIVQRPELSVTHISVVDLTEDGLLDLLVCESTGLRGATGRVTLYVRRDDGSGSRGELSWTAVPLALLPHPAHTEVFDFDGDGDLDIVVAVLGIFGPSESPRGEVALLVNQGGLRFEHRSLLRGVTRVADVQPADLNGDGRIDFAVAAFGHRSTGGVGWLEQREDGEFDYHVLIAKPGAIHVPVVDLDGDGALDIVALVSQHTEEIVLLRGNGAGEFRSETLYAGGMPEFGASGIELVDLDGDRDLDILLTNGDSADTGARTGTKFRPYHGVQWLENRGDLRFVPRELMRLYAAYSVTAGDLDGDGDTDVVAGSFFTDLDDPGRHSLVWLENDGAQNFTPHSLARIPRSIVSLALSDLDGDGRLDLVVGGLLMPGYARTRAGFDTTAPLSLWTRP